MKKWIGVAASLSLVACGGGNEDKEIISGTVKDDKGESTEFSVTSDGDRGNFSIKAGDGEFNITANADTDAKLPFGLKILPGATVKSNVQMNQGGEGTNGAMVTFESSASPDKIVDFYKAQATSAGFKIGTEITSGDTRMFNATRDEKDNINVSASAGDDGKTVGNIIAGTKG